MVMCFCGALVPAPLGKNIAVTSNTLSLGSQENYYYYYSDKWEWYGVLGQHKIVI